MGAFSHRHHRLDNIWKPRSNFGFHSIFANENNAFVNLVMSYCRQGTLLYPTLTTPSRLVQTTKLWPSQGLFVCELECAWSSAPVYSSPTYLAIPATTGEIWHLLIVRPCCIYLYEKYGKLVRYTKKCHIFQYNEWWYIIVCVQFSTPLISLLNPV